MICKKILMAALIACAFLCPTFSVTAFSAATEMKTDTPIGQTPLMEMPRAEDDPGYYFLMAEQAQAEGDMERVYYYYRKALDLDPTSPYLNTRIGTLLAKNRRTSDALIMARMALLYNPDYDEAYTLLGKIYTVTGDRDRAIESYNAALDLKPDEKDLYIFIGSLQASQKLFGDAEKTLKKMIERFPEDREGYFYLGKVYVETEQYDQAVETFQKLLDTGSDVAAQAHVELGTVYTLQKKYDEAEKHLREALELDKVNINARLNLAHVLASQKKYDQAYKVFEELSKLAPSNLSIQIRMALILAAQKQYEMAEKTLNKILETKPGWDQVRYHLGRVLREQGKVDEAEQEFTRIPKDAPSYLNSRLVMSLMFLRKRDYAKAIKYVDQALETDAKDPDLYHIRGSVLEEMHRYAEAMSNYQKSLELTPNDTRLLYSLGNVYEKSGRRGLGLATMEKLLHEKPDDASALNFVGYTLLSMGQDVTKAEECIRKAIDLKPDDGYIIDSLAWLFFKKGEREKALEQIENASEKVKSDPIIAEHQGDILVSLERKEDAVKAYQRSLESNPHNLMVQKKLRELEKELGKQTDPEPSTIK
jgi:tetratricopeptide (TPR) repeat protein